MKTTENKKHLDTWFAYAWCDKKNEQSQHIKIKKDLYKCLYCGRMVYFP